MEPNLSKKRKLELSSDSNICSNIELSKKPETNLSSKKDKNQSAGSDDTINIETYRNHIYFYCSVSKKTCLKLNLELKRVAQGIIDNGSNLLKKDKFIYLHINSFGGSVFSSFSTIDTIINLPVPVVSIIEGAAASAATLISVMCSYRVIYPNSYMLIHQLSSSAWGKMDEIEDEIINLKELMKRIKSIYKRKTDINKNALDDILKHDLWWNSKKCLEVGLVDKIMESKPVYEFDESNLEL
jgi:ATP-dependent protease ClpP protease subunit